MKIGLVSLRDLIEKSLSFKFDGPALPPPTLSVIRVVLLHTKPFAERLLVDSVRTEGTSLSPSLSPFVYKHLLLTKTSCKCVRIL